MKWKEYGPYEWLWEPVNNIKHAKDLMEKFHQQNSTKSKPHHAQNQKIEIPMTLFPQELFHPLPESLTELIPQEKPTASGKLAMAQASQGMFERPQDFSHFLSSFRHPEELR